MDDDLEFAFRLADAADAVTLRHWSSTGVASKLKGDGTPVTEADIAAERAMLALVQEGRAGDGFLGEEVGERQGATGRRWIVDGVDGTRAFAAGLRTWGTLIALETDAGITLGVSSSPAQDRRWWATRGGGAFVAPAQNRTEARQLAVADKRPIRPELVVTLPAIDLLDGRQRLAVSGIAGGLPVDRPWSHQQRVAEGQVDLCIWFAGDVWDHAAPSIIVEEAGGRFTDHYGGRRLDTRTAIYSSGPGHDRALAALRRVKRS